MQFIASEVSSRTGLPFSFANLARKVFASSGMSSLASAQGWHRNFHNVQPVKKVLPEFSLAYELFEILVRRGDEPHIHANLLVAAHPLERTLLAEHAQQFHLRVRVDLADLVEEQRAAVRLLEAPDSPLDRARERPALVAEQLALEQLRRERRAMHGDEFLGVR